MMIRELREYFGISQEEMAQRLRVSRSHLSMVESGRRTLSSEKNTELGKLFLAINGAPVENAAIGAEKIIETTTAGDQHFNDWIKLERLIYQHRLQKVNNDIGRLENSRERKAKRFMRMDILEQKSVKLRTHTKAPPLPNKDLELLKLQIKKCSCEAVLKFLEEAYKQVK